MKESTFDYLVSQCFTTMPHGFTEGQVFNSGGWSEFRAFSTVQGAVDHAASTGRTKTIAITAGTYGESVRLPRKVKIVAEGAQFNVKRWWEFWK